MESRKAKATVAGMVVLCACGILAYALSARGGGLEPTAPPGPTMHTLDEIYDVCSPSKSPFNVLTGGGGRGYIKFEGVDGDATEPHHTRWSDIIGFGQGHSLPDVGAVGTRGAVVFEPIGIVKELDKASVKLAEAVCTQKVFPEVEIHATATIGGTEAVYYAYELKNVLIVSYLIGSDTPPREQLAIEFEEITVTYFDYDWNTGNLLGRIEYTHRIK